MKKPYNKKFIQNQHDLLLNYKFKILNLNRTEESTIPKANYDQNIDPGDLALTYQIQDVAIGLQEHNFHQLREIELALDKIVHGSYGVCEESGEYIPKARLQNIPWTRYTIEVAEELERENYLQAA